MTSLHDEIHTYTTVFLSFLCVFFKVVSVFFQSAQVQSTQIADTICEQYFATCQLRTELKAVLFESDKII